jgi:hypothetical protein
MKRDYLRVGNQVFVGTVMPLKCSSALRRTARRISAVLCVVAFALVLGASAGLCAQLSAPPSAAANDYAVTERGPNHRVWSKVTWQPDASGQVTAHTNSYVELMSGLHYQDPKTGQWLESQEVIESYPGGAIARHGQHQVIFANNLATPGAIDVQTPDGKRLTSHVLGLSYFDASTGTNVLIAEVTNCLGKIVAPNQVIYENAFDTLQASVRYTYTRGGFEQDIILLESPESPAAYGLNPTTTRLVVMTEFINPPQPAVQPSMTTDATGAPVEDDAVNFGVMQMGSGKGFLLGTSGVEAELRVFKQWATIEERHFLIEQVRAADLFKAISSLPSKQGASLNTRSQAIRFTASSRQLPHHRLAKANSKPMELASARLPAKGYLLDYVAVVSTNNFTFRGDTTYYVSGGANLTGTTTIEGGSVIKFTNYFSARLLVQGVSCLTSPDRMALLTSKDDDSVGETIAGSTHNPTNYSALPSIWLEGNQSGTTLKYLRFSYASEGASIFASASSCLWHCQFIKCQTGVQLFVLVTPRYFPIYNCLFSGCGTNILTGVRGADLYGEHITADGGCFDAYPADTVTFVNSILTGCPTTGRLSLTNSITNATSAGIFQTVGAAGYYLVDGSTNRNSGTTNINRALLADLNNKTTYPPLVLTNITADTVLSPQAQRDTDLPDLGYHYDPIDYAGSGLILTNTLLLTNGVALATYGTSASLTLCGSGQLVSQGLANNLNHIVRYNTVQEQSTTNWATTSVSDSVAFASQSASAHCAFTAWSIPGGSGNHVNQAYDTTGSWFAHNQFTGGAFAMNPGLVALTNCLWERVALTLDDETDNDSWYLYNNLFRGGSLSYRIRGSSPVAVAYDNFFDRTSIAKGTGSANFTSGYNGYVTANTTLSGSQCCDVTLTNNPIYQTSYLGSYYYPTNGGLLSTLIDAGSRSAPAAGLYYFTTTTNQVPEGATAVDIGFHYVAIDLSTGQPYDADGDGIADYLEDANYNGVPDWLEIQMGYNPSQPNDLGKSQSGYGLFLAQPRVNSQLP